MIRSYNVNTNPSSTAIVLPRAFFSVPVPEGFHTINVNAFDITNVQGLKHYRLKQAYTPDRWGYLAVTRGAGALASPYTPRFFQFALKLVVDTVEAADATGSEGIRRTLVALEFVLMPEALLARTL